MIHLLFYLTLFCGFISAQSNAVNEHDGFASVRFIYVSPAAYKDNAKGTLSIDNSVVVEDVPYGKPTEYILQDPGKDLTSVVNDKYFSQVSLEANKWYTIVLYDGSTEFELTLINDSRALYRTQVDMASVRPIYLAPNTSSEALPSLYGVRGDCYNCLFPKLQDLKYPLDSNLEAVIVDTTFPFSFAVDKENLTSNQYPVDPRKLSAERKKTHEFDQAGVYTLLIFESMEHPGSLEWHVVTDRAGDQSIYTQLLLYFVLYFVIVSIIFSVLGKFESFQEVSSFFNHVEINETGNGNNNETATAALLENEQFQNMEAAKNEERKAAESESSNDNSQTFAQLQDDSSLSTKTLPAKKKRVQSLDTFRGISLFIMIFVNYGGGGYWFLDHSKWNGLTVADLVFPWFMFMMGASMGLIKSWQGRPWKTRALNLFFIGLFLNDGYYLNHWRVPGVLQRFGVSYAAVVLILKYVPASGNVAKDHPLRDILPFLKQYAIIFFLAILWVCLTFLPYVPHCGAGYIGPGGLLGDWGEYDQCTGGFALWLDTTVFGVNHIFTDPTPKDVYLTGNYDPEGLLGCLTSILMVYLGVICGRIVTAHKSHKARLTRWIGWGLSLIAIASILCGLRQNGGMIPINKNLWSLSFVIMLGGMANIALSMCYVLIDMKNLLSGLPFRAMGMNSIVIYCGSEVFQMYAPFSYHTGSATHQTHEALLLSHLIGVSCWLGVGYVLFRKKLFYNL